MKNIIFFVVIVVLLIPFKSVIGQGILNSDDFVTPPDHAKVHVWWHWIQGAISKEGITKDLESMKDQGVGQATIFNIGLLQKKDFFPDRILFRSPEWYAMFRFALEEADRLGIEIGIHNCDGWATSGGPWVKPENSMKQFVWTETIVEEGDNSKILLQKPKHKLNYYEDIAVLAVKNNDNISAFQRVKPKVYLNKINTERHLFDGCPFTGYEIKPKDTVNLHFENAITTNKIAIHLYKMMQSSRGNDPEDATTNFKMQFSNDNKHFQTLDTFKLSVINETSVISIPDIKAKYLRLIFNKTPKPGQHAPPYLTEVELLQDNENPLFQTDIPYYCAKIGICNVKDRNAFDISQENLSKKGLKRSEIINVSQYINEAGELNYSLPAGNWSIIRFGYTTTGKENSPATAEGTGLEVDKMDTTALNEFFAGFPQQLIEHAGNYTGNTFKFLLIDSWEANLQNWTNEFPKHFEKGRAYDIISWIPALCGKTVEDNRQTEAFLYDFRLTIADLIEQNYYKHFRTLCYRNKLEFHAEVIYGGFGYPSLDVIKTNSYTDMPMMEYWTSDINNGKINYKPSRRPYNYFAPHSATAYQKKLVGAEAYTSRELYTMVPFELKPYGDKAYCSGVNSQIMHSYVHQPFEKKPGVTLGGFGGFFNRHNPIWSQFKGFNNYQARVQYILQSGYQIANVLYYVGDELPQIIDAPKIDFGYQHTICNFDILKNNTSVKEGKILLNNQQTYQILVLPETQSMNFQTLKVLSELVKRGAVILGNKPTDMLSLNDLSEKKSQFKKLVSQMWKKEGMNKYGKGKIYWQFPLEKAMALENIKPDFYTKESSVAQLFYIHKTMGDQEVYFVANQTEQLLEKTCVFRTLAKNIEIWNPQSGLVKQVENSKSTDGNTSITVQFEPYESLFFIFSDNEITGKIMSKAPTSNPVVFEVSNLQGTIAFEPWYDKKITPVDFDKSRSLTDFSQKDIKYFAGIANYQLNFTVPDSLLNSTYTKTYLNIGETGTTSEIILNGTSVGNSWIPGQQQEISGVLQKNNILNIQMAIPFHNRIMGDLIEGENHIWTTDPLNNYLKQHPELKEIGLMETIKLLFFQ